MAKYIIKRVAMGIFSIFIVATVTFFVMNLVPGGPFVAEKSISAAAHEDAALAMKQLPKLAECQAHTSVMLSPVDIKKLKQLGIQFTMEAKYENNKNYH